jgi:hypothetical protein
MRKTPVYWLVIWISLALAMFLLYQLSPTLSSPEFFPVDDFAHLWASGRIFLSGGNPYDAAQLALLQNQIGAAPAVTEASAITLNPPWALLILVPFGMLNYSLARLAWLLVNVTLILVSAQMAWRIYTNSTNKTWLAGIIAFSFAPTISVLSKGQITPWILLGIVGFLIYTAKDQYTWVGGASLVLCTIKPHLAYLLWPAIGLWIIGARQWKLLFVAVLIFFISALSTLLFDQQIYSQYLTAIRSFPAYAWATPTIGSHLRYFWLGEENFWVQYILPVLSTVWLIYHYQRNARTWQWHKELPVLLLVSLVTSPYAWTYDQVILLPAILAAVHLVTQKRGWIAAILVAIYFLINVLELILHKHLNDFWFLWLAPAYFLWYLASSRYTQLNPGSHPALE